jgi:hypothetical protein
LVAKVEISVETGFEYSEAEEQRPKSMAETGAVSVAWIVVKEEMQWIGYSEPQWCPLSLALLLWNWTQHSYVQKSHRSPSSSQ